MIYAISDLHGCYDKFMKMLDKIRFSGRDTLYILGDVVDRGSGGVKLIQELAGRKNIIVLRGNHDDTAFRLLRYYDLPLNAGRIEKLMEIYRLWLSDGGDATLDAYRKLCHTEREKVLSFLSSLPIYEEICVNGRHFFLSHTVPEKEKMQEFDSCRIYDFIMGEPEYEKVYFPAKYIVTGHTPTGLIDKRYAGRIWQENNHIAIDCGAVFGNPLGCICLNTLEEYYVT